MKKFSLMLCMVCALSGCASIVSGVNQSVSVDTPPVEGAKCSLQNSKGKWFVPKTPGSVTVQRSYGDLNLHCDKEGYPSVDQKVESSTKGMVFGNIIFGFFSPIGAGVDIATGAAYDYPVSIVAPMGEKTQH